MSELRPAKILMIDDDQLVLQLAKLVFKRAKISNVLHYVESAEEALEYMQSNKVDLCFCDMHMPGMLGVELLVEMQNDPKLS